jgi:hypothetical protein
MLHKCANPSCPSVFRSLRHGKLFLVQTDDATEVIFGASLVHRRERPVRRVERYWLCERCSFSLP